MKKLLFFTGILILGLMYLLIADAPVLILESQVSEYQDIQAWIGTDVPVPIERSDTKHMSPQSKPGYFYPESGEYFGKIIQNNRQLEISWYNVNNDLLARISEYWEADIPLPRYFLTHNLDRIIGVDIYNRIRLFDTTGKPINEFRVFEGFNYNTENVTYCNYIQESELLFIGFRQVFPISASEQGYNCYLTLVDLDGNEFFSQSFPGWQINGITSSPSGEYFLIPMHTYQPDRDQFVFRTILLNKTGKIISDLPVQHNKAVFNKNNTMVAFYKNEMAWLYDISSKKIIKTYAVSDSRNIFISGLLIDDKQLFLLQEGEVYQESGNWAYRHNVLTAIEYGGDVLQTQSLDAVVLYKPVLKYENRLEQLFVGHSQGWMRFNINK